MSPLSGPLARYFHIIGVLLMLGLLAGCSAIRLSYNHATSLTYWWLDSYADFDNDQESAVRQQLNRLHAWHRQNELPAYAKLLAEMHSLALEDVTESRVCGITEQIRQRLLSLSDQSARSLAEVVSSLGPDQYAAIQKKFEKTNKKWREEWLDLSTAELAEYRLGKARERAENFYGSLENNQIALMQKQIAASSYKPGVSWVERQRRQKDILNILREHRSGARAAHQQAEMMALLRRSFEPPDAAYRAQSEKLIAETCQMITALHNSTTPVQRRHLQQKLKDYELDALTLAARKD